MIVDACRAHVRRFPTRCTSEREMGRYSHQTRYGKAACLCRRLGIDGIGDNVNIISPLFADVGSSAVIEVSFKTPATFLIHHPYHMLTMTSIANAMPCPRKPILQALVKSSGPASKPILYGNIGHTLLQTALSDRDFSADSTRRVLDTELKKESIKLDIWGAGLGVEDVRVEVAAQAETGFQAFGDKWVAELPKVCIHLSSVSYEILR